MSTTFRALRDSDGNPISTTQTYARGITWTVAGTTTTAGSTGDFTAGTQFVELVASALCYYRLGTSTESALLTDTPLAANVPRIVPVGTAKRIAGITQSGTARLHATEL